MIATVRNAKTKLSHLEETRAAIFDLDVTSPQTETDEKVKQAIAIYDHIGVPVNNAGCCQMGLAEETDRVSLLFPQHEPFCGAVRNTLVSTEYHPG